MIVKQTPDDFRVEELTDVRPEAVFISCTNTDHLDTGYGLVQLIAASFPDLLIVAGGSAFARDRNRSLAAGAFSAGWTKSRGQ